MTEVKMFYKAGPLIFANAKELRNNPTHAEMLLWGYLKTKPLGYKFRRQHPIGIYIADFYCHKLKLVIEVDGSIHSQQEVKEHDEERQRIIEEEGIKVIRFTNRQIECGLEDVIKLIHPLLHD
jgi:imidazole glycerol-phosphate synthase subunit HisF